MRFFVLAVVVLLPLRGARAAPPDRIDRRGTSEVVEAAANAIRDNYVFAEDAERVGRELRARLRTGAYRHVRRKQELAQRLTGDLVEITGDQHFSVGVDAAWVRAFREASESDAVASPQDPAHQRAAAANFGFQSVRLLPGNVGYVRLDHFDDPDVGAPVAAAAMRFVEHTDALIFDLRYNRGGTMAMAQLLMSYLFEADEAQLLFDFTTTESGEALERGMWVLPSVPGRRRPERPAYVLTGSTSFSAAEWFSFALQKLGRAEIIGERTTGAAHPVASVPIDDT
ncbi:MAG: S41 family peptidase, partial [Myxococcales bacterium]|nr:S41 family peptidase [Myxococcales bacterium]